MGILDTIKAKTTKKSVPAKKEDAKVEKAEKKVVTKSVAKKVDAKDTGNAYKLLLAPLVTEKSTHLTHNSVYTFKVAQNANKIEITKAIKALYNVDVDNVNIINVRGKIKRVGANLGKRKDYKKALVTLAKGQKISVFEGV